MTLVRGAEPLPGGALLPHVTFVHRWGPSPPAGRASDRPVRRGGGLVRPRRPGAAPHLRRVRPARLDPLSPLRRLARPSAPGDPAPVSGGLPADGGRRRLRAGAPGRAGVQGARAGRSWPPRSARRWRWRWPRSSPPSLGRRRAVLLVPVPSSAAALRERGRDHVRELTVRAVRELRAAGCLPPGAGCCAAADACGTPQGSRPRSGGPTWPARSAPAAGPPRGVLVLVDDVVTSGATLTEAARRCSGRSAGGPPVLGAVVAATPAAGSAGHGRCPTPPERSRTADRLSGPRGRD